MVEELPAAEWHIQYILDNLSAQNLDEFNMVGMTKEGAFRLFQDFMKKGEAETGLIDGEPIVAMGVFRGSDGLRNFSWFVATDKYWKLGAAGVRFGRKYLLAKREQYDPLWTVSCSPRQDVDRWFRLLGYEKQDEEGPFRWFKYAPKHPISTATRVNPRELASPTPTIPLV